MASIYDWSLTAASNSSADGDINWAEGQAPSSVNGSARAMMERVAEFLADIGGTLTAGGTANGITVTANSGFTTLANGRMLSFIAASDNTAATTLNVNGIGAKAIRYMSSSGDAALTAGIIQAGGVYVVQYNTAANGSAGAWLLVNPTLTSLFTALVSSTTDNTLPRFNGTAGALQTSGVTVDDSNNVTGVVALTATGAVTAPSATISGSAPTITLTDTDTGGDCSVSAASASGSISISADSNNEVASSVISFNVDGTQRATIDGNGNLSVTGDVLIDDDLLIGVDTVISMANAEYGLSFENGGLFQLARDGAVAAQYKRSDDGALINMFRGTSNVGSISVTSTATAYNTSSDYRLKSNVIDFSASGAMIDALRPVSFIWSATGEEAVGFIAHEVQDVFPAAITGEKDGEEMQAGDWSKLVPILVAELKAVRARLAALEA